MTAPAEIDAEVAVVGAGVVGLAVAAELARDRSVVVIERHEGFARETSSHNSQIVHAGVFYTTGSLKHRLCIEGNRLLYSWCDARGVPTLRAGKLIVALDASELEALDEIARLGDANGVPAISRLTEAQARSLEPAVPAVAALHSESSGVVDAFAFARSLEAAARDAGVLFAYRHEVRAVERTGDAFSVEMLDPNGGPTRLRCAAVVNAAGHGAPSIAESLGYPLDGVEGVPAMRQHVNRGRYYDIVGAGAPRVERPIYPVPAGRAGMGEHLRSAGGLGLHITLDTDGAVRLGPDTGWFPAAAPLDYRVDDHHRDAFLAAGRRLLPGLRDEDIAPGQVGYRPKLQGPGDEPADFLIWPDRGYVHLGGIESPGLTASLAVAREVADLLR